MYEGLSKIGCLMLNLMIFSQNRQRKCEPLDKYPTSHNSVLRQMHENISAEITIHLNPCDMKGQEKSKRRG